MIHLIRSTILRIAITTISIAIRQIEEKVMFVAKKVVDPISI